MDRCVHVIVRYHVHPFAVRLAALLSGRTSAVFTPILGRVGDMTGKDRMFVVALAALAAGSLLAAVATSIGVIVSR